MHAQEKQNRRAYAEVNWHLWLFSFLPYAFLYFTNFLQRTCLQSGKKAKKYSVVFFWSRLLHVQVLAETVLVSMCHRCQEIDFSEFKAGDGARFSA